MLTLFIRISAFIFLLCPFTAFAQCEGDVCTIFEVTIVYAQGDAPVRKRTIAREYASPNGQTHVRYQEILERDEKACTKRVQVPAQIYHAVTKLMASLSGDGEDAPPTLTPAQQSMLLFYTTLMQQTLNFDCTKEMNQTGAGL